MGSATWRQKSSIITPVHCKRPTSSRLQGHCPSRWTIKIRPRARAVRTRTHYARGEPPGAVTVPPVSGILALQGGFSMNEASFPRIAAGELALAPPVGGVHQGDGSIGGGRAGIRVD